MQSKNPSLYQTSSFNGIIYLLEECKELCPLMDIEAANVIGGLFSPCDGHIDPYSLTQAIAIGARKHGAIIQQKTEGPGAFAWQKQLRFEWDQPNNDVNVKICDFGLSRGFGELDEIYKKTVYVVTRWYRAPEVSLLIRSYNESLDMWSVGCIFAELLQRTTLFPGDTNANQVILVL